MVSGCDFMFTLLEFLVLCLNVRNHVQVSQFRLSSVIMRNPELMLLKFYSFKCDELLLQGCGF